MRTIIQNAVVLTPFRKVTGAVVVEDGTIARVLEGDCREKADLVIDAQGRYLSPGFIELHTHGAGGHDFMDGSIEAVQEACRDPYAPRHHRAAAHHAFLKGRGTV